MEQMKVSTILIGLAIFVALLGVPMLVSADGGDTSLVHACVNPSGVAKIITPDGTCSSSETPVHWSSASPRTVPAAFTVDCNAGQTIQGALGGNLIPGDTLLVSGTCNENVTVTAAKAELTLDGQKSATNVGATINGGITTNGRAITVKGFTVTGGFQGRSGISVTDGATALLDNNVVRGVGMTGVSVNNHSFAEIRNNTIENNGLNGILVNRNSLARIGFQRPPPARVLMPNTIQGNATGVLVQAASQAGIFGNKILINTGLGVRIGGSQADIVGNTIDGNIGDGIRVQENSGAFIGTDTTSVTATIDDDTNSGANGGFAIRCFLDGYVNGNQGALTGTLGGQSFSSGCNDSVSP